MKQRTEEWWKDDCARTKTGEAKDVSCPSLFSFLSLCLWTNDNLITNQASTEAEQEKSSLDGGAGGVAAHGQVCVWSGLVWSAKEREEGQLRKGQRDNQEKTRDARREKASRPARAWSCGGQIAGYVEACWKSSIVCSPGVRSIYLVLRTCHGPDATGRTSTTVLQYHGR